MPKFEVQVPEIHYQTFVVEAPDEEGAIRSIMDGNGEVIEGELEYSCIHEPGLETMLADVSYFDWAIIEIEKMCDRCGEEDSTTTRFIGDKTLSVCDLCANNEERDSDE